MFEKLLALFERAVIALETIAAKAGSAVAASAASTATDPVVNQTQDAPAPETPAPNAAPKRGRGRAAAQTAAPEATPPASAPAGGRRRGGAAAAAAAAAPAEETEDQKAARKEIEEICVLFGPEQDLVDWTGAQLKALGVGLIQDIPADKVIEVANTFIEKYEEEFPAQE